MYMVTTNDSLQQGEQQSEFAQDGVPRFGTFSAETGKVPGEPEKDGHPDSRSTQSNKATVP